MVHLILAIVYFIFKQCDGHLAYGTNGYCSNCNNGATSQGLALPSSTTNSDLSNQMLYSLPISSSSFIPSNSYGTGTGYTGTQANNNLNYGSPSTMGMSWNNAYNSGENYSAGNGYINCHNSNCLSNAGFRTAPGSLTSIVTDYDIAGINAFYNPYFPLTNTNYGAYSLPARYNTYFSSGILPGTYLNSNLPGLENGFTLQPAQSSYPTMYTSYGDQSSINSLNSMLSLPSYQRSLKTAAADDASGIRPLRKSSSLASL